MGEVTKNEQLMSRLEGIRKALMAHHESGANLPNATKGAERETLIREFLARVFPTPYRFGSGAVIDNTGLMSGQLDVVVEFPFFPSFPTPGSEERLYLAESIAFVIEVKSDLISQWVQVEHTVEKLQPLRRVWSGSIQSGKGGKLTICDTTTSRIPFVAVGYRGYGKLEDLETRISETPVENRPDAVLVIETGAYTCGITGSRGVGTLGFFALCADLVYFATNVMQAQADFSNYFKDI